MAYRVNTDEEVARQSSHALVVGGTGMLRQASLELARRGHVVSVVARRTSRLKTLEHEASAFGGRINPLALDWRDERALYGSIAAAGERLGPPVLAVVWIHGSAPDASWRIGETLARNGVPFDFYHVLGSSAADPSRPNPERRARFEALPHIRYHEVILGFVPGPGGSRWLTNAEISQGVISAIDQGAPRHIVGTVEPWSARP